MVGTREGTKIGGLVMREIDVGWDSISPVPVHAGIVPIHKNHVDVEIVPIPESHVDTGTIPILESRVDTGTVHVHVDMSTGGSDSLEERRPYNAALDAMSHALRKVARSPFSNDIE